MTHDPMITGDQLVLVVVNCDKSVDGDKCD